MKGKVHLMLQSKGGVGKSFVCTMLAQYQMSKGATPLCIDTDPVNGTFHGYRALNVVNTEVLEGKEIIPRKFDQLLDLIRRNDDGTDVIIDTGPSTFLPISHYLLSHDIPGLFQELGYELVVHSVVVGGPAMAETLAGFTRLTEDFPRETTFVIWLNPFLGPVERNGADFEDLTEYQALRHRVTGIVRIPEYSSFFEQDLADMLQMRLTFDETLKSGLFWLLNLQRLVMIKRELFGLIDSARILSPATANNKTGRIMSEDRNLQPIIDSIAKKYHIILKPDDPIMVALAANEAILDRYEESTRNALVQFGSKIEGISDQLISESKTTASKVLQVAAEDGKEHILEVAGEAGERIKKILDGGIKEGEKLYKAVRWERWICLSATVLSMAFALLVFLMTRR